MSRSWPEIVSKEIIMGGGTSPTFRFGALHIPSWLNEHIKMEHCCS